MPKLACLLALLGGLPLFAQSWDGLQVLKPGDHVVVSSTSGKEVRGAFKAVTPEAIVLTSETVERSTIRRVQVRVKSRRVRNLLIGAAIGVAVGVLADSTVGAYMRNEAGESSGARVASYAAPIGVFAGIGAALPGYRTVYRVK